jgi:hypothetical protein
MDSSGSKYDPVVDCCESGIEPSGSVKVEEFLSQLSDYKLHGVNI